MSDCEGRTGARAGQVRFHLGEGTGLDEQRGQGRGDSCGGNLFVFSF